MLNFKQWTKRRKKKESNYERPTSQTDREIRNQDDQGKAAGLDTQEHGTGVHVFPIAELEDHRRGHHLTIYTSLKTVNFALWQKISGHNGNSIP
jgi:hypothetical protein